MNLNVDKWKEFQLNDLFDIEAGLYHYTHEYSEGSIPYVSASNLNNGILQKIDLTPDFDGNCITTGKVGCTAFYQPNPFCATSDVNILVPKNFKLNEKIGLFMVTVINSSENYKWNYGRQCRVGDSKEIVIKLPILMDKDSKPKIDCNLKFSPSGFIPDWQFMEDYITSLNHKPITTKLIKDNNAILDKSNWKEYKLGKLFEKIYKSEAYVKGELEFKNYPCEGYINFITRTDENNGCDCYVKIDDTDNIEQGNAIIIGDTTSTIYYQPEDFVTGDHIVVCRANWINKYTALFIKSILERERYRYSYGRAFKMDLIKSTSIKLPTKNNNPDWEFMENYIKSLLYGDRI